MTSTKTTDGRSTFGADVKMMPTDSENVDWSTPHGNTQQNEDGFDLLSSLLLSMILKLEDREYRVKDQRTQSADKSSDHTLQKRFDGYNTAGALVKRKDSWDYSTDSNTEDTETVGDDDHDNVTEVKSERSQVPNDPTGPNYNQITQSDSTTEHLSSGLSLVRSKVSEDMLPSSTHPSENDQTSLCKQGQRSAYKDSAVNIVGDAMLRAIANIFTNAVVRRGVRTYGITIWNLTDSRNVAFTNESIDQPLSPTSDDMRQIKPKPDLISTEWLHEVNRRIAAPEVTNVGDPDSMPPSVASSCNVSRCSSMDILSGGDRALKVKAIHPSQSKLLWRVVQKSHSNNKKPAEEPDLIPGYVSVSDESVKEKKVELSKALKRVKESSPRKRFWGERSTDVESSVSGTCLEVDRLIKFRDSGAQTEKKDFQKDDKSTGDDGFTDTKQKIVEQCVEVDHLVKFRDSGAQTEKKDLQKDDKSTGDDGFIGTKQKIIEQCVEVDHLVKFRDSGAQTEKKDLQKYDKPAHDNDVVETKQKIVEEGVDGTCLEVDRLVTFRDSVAQTEKKDFQKDDKPTRDDDIIETKQKSREAKSPVPTDEGVMTDASTAQTNQAQVPTLHQVKHLSVPPTASPLLMDVVWRNASDNDMTNREKSNFKAHFARGGLRDTEQAKGVVESALHRAVSAVFVERVISGSLDSLTDLNELRITPSFKKAAADLTQGPPPQFEWFPYLEGSAGPCKVTDRRRQRKEKTQPRIIGSSESADVYVDAREKFSSSDDLLFNDEFTDAVCDPDCAAGYHVSAKKPSTIDKGTQVSHTAYGKDSCSSPSDDVEDEPQTPAAQLELPMESIHYIKDQFNDVKDLVAKYRELLYEPLDESAPVGSEAQPYPDDERTSTFREVKTWQNEPGSDETDEEDDVVAQKPNQKHTQDKDIKKALGKLAKIEKQSVKLAKDGTQSEKKNTIDKNEKTEKGKKEKKEILQEGREVASANQGTFNNDEDNATSTQKQQVEDRSTNVKDKRKKDDSPTRDKTSVRRTLKKTGDKIRTPSGRQRIGKNVHEKTTRDGFLSLNDKVEPNKSIESEEKTGANESLKGGTISSRKTEDKASRSSKKTDEEKPKVKNHISFFEKFSKHSLKRSDQTRPSSNSPSPEKNNVAHQSDEMNKSGRNSGKRDKQVNPESCVDSTPGKGIWTNKAFFEALGDSDDQTVSTSEPPKTEKKILEDGLLDEPRNEEDGQPGPSLKSNKEISRREKSPKRRDEKSKSPSSRRKKKPRNKNTNNEALLDQVTTDESCISSSQCSCTDTPVDASSKTEVDRLLSSEAKNCDDDTVSGATKTESGLDSRSDESLNICDAETTENSRHVSSSPCSDSKMENEDNAAVMNNITPQQRLSVERVNTDEATTTKTTCRCVSISPSSDTNIDKEVEAFLSHNITTRQQLSSESPSNIKAENEEYVSKSNDIVFDQMPSSDGPSGGHSNFQIYHDQDERNTVNMKENTQATERVTEYELLDRDDSVVLQSKNHDTHIGQAISEDPTEEDTEVTSVDDLLTDLSLNDDLSIEVQIHSPPPTEELDDVSSLNDSDVPLLTSSPHQRRHLRKIRRAIEKIGVPDQTPPILQNSREDDDDGNDGGEDSEDDLIHHLRNTSFLLACNPDRCMSKDPTISDVQINEDVDERKTQDEEEGRTSNKPMENLHSQSEIKLTDNPTSQSEIQPDGVNIFKVSAQPESEHRSSVCQATTSGGKQEAGSKVKPSLLEPERRTSGEQKSCLRFSLFRKSKKRSRSKNVPPGQSKEKQRQSSDNDGVPPDETHTACKVEEEDAVDMVTKECTNKEVDVSTDSNPTPPSSHKRKFRLKYLMKSKKRKESLKT